MCKWNLHLFEIVLCLLSKFVFSISGVWCFRLKVISKVMSKRSQDLCFDCKTLSQRMYWTKYWNVKLNNKVSWNIFTFCCMVVPVHTNIYFYNCNVRINIERINFVLLKGDIQKWIKWIYFNDVPDTFSGSIVLLISILQNEASYTEKKVFFITCFHRHILHAALHITGTSTSIRDSMAVSTFYIINRIC